MRTTIGEAVAAVGHRREVDPQIVGVALALDTEGRDVGGDGADPDLARGDLQIERERARRVEGAFHLRPPVAQLRA